MNSRVKKYSVRLLALALASTIAGTVAISFKNGDAAGSISQATASAGMRDVTGEVDLSALRSKYFDPDTVLANNYSPDEERWTIVELEGDSVLDRYLEGTQTAGFPSFASTGVAKRRAETLENEHRAFLNRLKEEGIEYELRYSYTSILNGVAVKVTRADAAAISRMDGVKSISFSESYAAPQAADEAVVNDANVYSTGIYNSADLAEDGIEGQGMVVAILDTGLDFSHEAFQNMPENPRLTEDSVRGIFNKNNLELQKKNPSTTFDEIYYNAKVPFAFDYADDDPDVFPSYNSHGTHVAGIVAGKSNKQVNKNDPSETFLGVAPEAQLAIFKVFTDDPDNRSLGGADTMDILAALTDCVLLGVDVINMSLGSSAGFSEETGDESIQKVYNAIEEAGISLVCAASNDYSSGYGGGHGTNLASNPDSGTVGSPSTYSAAISVASINGQQSRYMKVGPEGKVAFLTNSSDANGNEMDFIERLFEKYRKKDAEEGTEFVKNGVLRLNYVVVGGLGETSDYGSAVQRQLQKGDTIALVKRGTTTFQEKVQNAQANGAVACIIYNNLSGVIRMSLGDLLDPIPACSVTMEAGEAFTTSAEGRVGTVEFSETYMAGPFMSDFSSWGPTPDLKLKPEISAHGGEIISAVAGGYDEYSGTSMASPNMAGAVTLLRQYVKNHPEKYHLEADYFDDNTNNERNRELSDLVYQLLMSTATIARNEEGNPYSPRKQGAGLADISAAVHTNSYLTVKDGNGKDAGRTKLELGDDPSGNGVWDMKFSVHNVGEDPVTFTPKPYIMTETLAIDGITVAEKAHMLDDSTTVFSVDNVPTEKITVAGGQETEVSVRIQLGEAGKKYIRDSFVNGMFVEGFLSLVPDTPSDENRSLVVPFLAFYGDWTKAPLFDFSTYDLAESRADPAVPEEDKLVASAADTRALGLYYEEQYIIPLGSYFYNMSPYDAEIYPDTQKAAISMWDPTVLANKGQHTIYELYMIYAGLLRGAKTLDITIRNKATGEVVFHRLDYNQRKSYAAGGGNRGSAVMLEINPYTWNLSNNVTYTFEMKGTLDYEGEYASEPDRNSFDFEFTVDTESPTIENYQFRYEPYQDGRTTKYRIYLDLDVSDNQYLMDVMPCYIYEDRAQGNTLGLITDYPVPMYTGRGETKHVSIEVTDYYEEIVEKGELYVAVEDYAMNQTVYTFSTTTLDNNRNYPESVTLKTDSKLEYASTETDSDGTQFDVYNLTLAPNESYRVTMNALPDEATAGALQWLPGNSSVLVKDREIFAPATSEGRTARILLVTYEQDPETGNSTRHTLARIDVTVEGEARNAPEPQRIVLEPVFGSERHLVDLNNGYLSLNPGQQVKIVPSVEPWYAPALNFTFTENRDGKVIKLDEDGTVTAVSRGTAVIVISPGDDSYRTLQKRVTVTVGYDYEITNYTLYEWYGNGENNDGVVVIPEHLNVMYLDENCFRNNTSITKLTLPSTLTEIPERAFEGCTNLREIVIPGACVYIKNFAFRGCSSLERVVLQRFEKKLFDKNNKEVVGEGTLTLGRGAFLDCRALTTIVHSDRITTVYESAFQGCTSLQYGMELDENGEPDGTQTALDLTGLRIAFGYAFSGCTSIDKVVTGEYTRFGDYMFYNCTNLGSIEIKSDRVGNSAFRGCRNLQTVTFDIPENITFHSIGANAFEGCTKLTEIALPDNGTYRIGERAFYNTGLTKLTVGANAKMNFEGQSVFANCADFTQIEIKGNHNPNYTVQGNFLYSADKSVLVLVPVGYTGEVTLDSATTEIGPAALSGGKLQTFDGTNIVTVGAHAFANCTNLTTVTFGEKLESIGEGVFYACSSLSGVMGLGNVTVIPAQAFESCAELSSIDWGDGLTSIGARAFFGTKVSALPDGTSYLTEIGSEAFRKAELTSVNLQPTGELKIGNNAFRENKSLTSVTLKNVTEMGEYAFADCTSLATVILGDGCKEVGRLAFAVTQVVNGVENVMMNSALTSVTFRGVETVGAFAFAGTSELKSVTGDSSVKTIGDGAFAESGLTSFRFDSALTIGREAFSGCTALTSVNLPAATIIGDGAFYRSGLTSVSLDSAERIGQYAFAETEITSVRIPSTLQYTYDDVWQRLNDAGYWEDVLGKKSLALGQGAFARNLSLKKFEVDGNPYYRAINGVLFAQVENGLVLVQYPMGSPVEEYEIPEGTVRIGDSAFEGLTLYDEADNPVVGSTMLKTVTVPYTVESIGSSAFYASEVVNYIFEGVEAPVLEAGYNATVEAFCDYINEAFASQLNGGRVSTDMYYSNFVQDFFMLREMAMLNNPAHLSVSYPENGKGYDSYVWKTYFDETETTDYAMERITHRAQNAIKGIQKTPEEIAGMSLDEVKRFSEDVVRPARALFNQVLDTRQAEMIASEGETLLAAEKAVRDRRAALGDPVKVEKLVLVSGPAKNRYAAGEKFDPAGMVIKAVYEDTSETNISDYTVTYASEGQKALTEDDTFVNVSYEGQTLRVYLTVTSGDMTEEEKKGCGRGCGKGCGSAIGSYAIILTAAIAAGGALLFGRRRKDD